MALGSRRPAKRSITTVAVGLVTLAFLASWGHPESCRRQREPAGMRNVMPERGRLRRRGRPPTSTGSHA